MNKTLSNKQNKHAFKKTKGLQINKRNPLNENTIKRKKHLQVNKRLQMNEAKMPSNKQNTFK